MGWTGGVGGTGGGVGVERDCVTFSLVPAAVLRLEFRQITYELMSPKVEKTTFVSFYNIFFSNEVSLEKYCRCQER